MRNGRLSTLWSHGWQRVLAGVLVLFIGASAIVQCGRLANEIFPRRTLVTPVLVMDVDLSETESQDQPFSLKYSGRHSVRAQLRLRDGPAGMSAEPRKFVLAGRVEILDEEEGGSPLVREFRRALVEYEVGTELFAFDAAEVGLNRLRMFRITVQVAPDFRGHYSEMKVFIKKELKYPILD